MLAVRWLVLHILESVEQDRVEAVAADDVEGIGVIVDIPLVLFQEARLVVRVER